MGHDCSSDLQDFQVNRLASFKSWSGFLLKTGGSRRRRGVPPMQKRQAFPESAARTVRIMQPVCPHCDIPMVRWSNPQQSTWSGECQFVCFNDGCPYFIRGWEWMKNQYNVKASYRCRIDPNTGASGPLPVWSKNAMRGSILQELEDDSK